MIIHSVQHRGLLRLIEDDDTRELRTDLVKRLRKDAPLNEATDTKFFYGGGAQGYTDYPALAD